jgi:hypothetical protein
VNNLLGWSRTAIRQLWPYGHPDGSVNRLMNDDDWDPGHSAVGSKGKDNDVSRRYGTNKSFD